MEVALSNSPLDVALLPTDENLHPVFKHKIFVFCGPPGVGKGTHAAAIAKRLRGVVHISTGDLFREEVKNNTAIGKIIGPIMDSGNFVPPEYANVILFKNLSHPRTRNGVILDGFPRSLEHLEDLKPMLHKLGRALSGVIYMDMSEEESVKRLGGRRICSVCKRITHVDLMSCSSINSCCPCGVNGCLGTLGTRKDDTEEVIRKRFRLAQSSYAPLLAEFQTQDLLFTIHGAGGSGISIEKITDKILEVMCFPHRFYSSNSAMSKLKLLYDVEKTMSLRVPLPPVSELAVAYTTAALKENESCGKRSGKMRRFVYLLTDNKLKLKEFVRVFDRYGIEVLPFPPLLPEPFIHALLTEKTADLVPLACLKEDSRLYRPGSTQDSSQRPGALANHFSVLRAWSRNTDPTHTAQSSYGNNSKKSAVKMTKYMHTTEGRMCERVMGVWNTGPVFGWDDQFVLLATGKTYQEHLQGGLKISSRDMVISAYLQDKVYYRQLKNLRHAPVELSRPVDFSVDVASFVQQETLYNTPCAHAYGLVNMLTHVLNEGVFFKGADTRLEANYWQPGLNAGLPLMAKKDNIHEKTFMFHDFGHFLMKDLIFTGTNSLLHRNVYIIHRMISEAVTIMLADGVFVDSLRRSGVEYDFNERRIYPIVCDTGLDLSNCESDRDGYVDYLKHLFKASVDFTVKGDHSAFKSMLRNHGADDTNWVLYRNKFHPFFVSDYQWTAHNYQNMSSRANEMTLWWQLTAPVREQLDLHLETIDDFIAELPAVELSRTMQLDGDFNSSCNTSKGKERDSISNMVDLVFESVFERRIRPVLSVKAGHISLDDTDRRRRRGFLRYMIGQMGIYARFWSVPATKKHYEKIVEMLTDHSNSVTDIRATYEKFVDLLTGMNLISTDDSHNFKETYPLFEPFYVTYDRPEEYPDLEEVIREVLSMQSYRRDQRDLAEQFMGRALTSAEVRYGDIMRLMVEHCGGQVEQGMFVTVPGVMLLATDQPSLAADGSRITVDPSTHHATFLLCGVALETSLELIAHGEAAVARLTSSKTASMNVPLFRVQQSTALETIQYLQLMQQTRSSFEARQCPRKRWESGMELFNSTAPGCKATALVYTMTLADFHKLFIGRMGQIGNELEVQQLVRIMAEKLHALHPELILPPDAYLCLSNGEKYAAPTPIGAPACTSVKEKKEEALSLSFAYLNVEPSMRVALQPPGPPPRVQFVSDTVLTPKAKGLFHALNINTSPALPDAFQLAEFRSRITYLAFPQPKEPLSPQRLNVGISGEEAGGTNNTDPTEEVRAYMNKMTHELQHLSVVSASRVSLSVPVPVPMTLDAETASLCPTVMMIQQQVLLSGGVCTEPLLMGQPVGQTDNPGGQSLMFVTAVLTVSMSLKGFHKLFHSLGKLIGTPKKDAHGLRNVANEMVSLLHEKYNFVINSPKLYDL